LNKPAQKPLFQHNKAGKSPQLTCLISTAMVMGLVFRMIYSITLKKSPSHSKYIQRGCEKITLYIDFD